MVICITFNKNNHLTTIIMYKVYNKIEGYNIFEGNGTEFIAFMKLIVIEDNASEDYSIIGLSDALEYLEEYCDNLELV